MRALLCLPLLLLGGCEQVASPEIPERETYRSARDGLCLVRSGDSLRAGLIVYGRGNANCSAAGTATRESGELVLAPRGDDHCRISVRIEGNSATIGSLSRQCVYYCGPGADFSGRRLERAPDAAPVTDFAGDPLC